MKNMTDKMDAATREQLIRKLGHQQYLILLTMGTIDNMNTLTAYAARKHAAFQAMATRPDVAPRTPIDEQYDRALQQAHLQASYATVTDTLDALRHASADADAIPVAPLPRADVQKEIEEFAADVMEALTFGTVKKQWWLK